MDTSWAWDKLAETESIFLDENVENTMVSFNLHDGNIN